MESHRFYSIKSMYYTRKMLLFLAVLAFSSCSAMNSSSTAGSISTRPAGTSEDPDVRLGPGDIISIKSYTDSLPSGDFPISRSGTIIYPYIGEVKVAGHTTSEIQDIIIQKLRDGFFRNPVISVSIKELNTKRITVFGSVRKPGVFPYMRPISLLEVLSMAGGLTDSADRDAITLIRRMNGREYRMKISIDAVINGTSANMILRPGDVIVVPKKVF